jgi:hypothetical protein
MDHRLRILRLTLLPEPDRGKARIGIRWHTGASDEPLNNTRNCRYPPAY